jgi:hypothetical protein
MSRTVHPDGLALMIASMALQCVFLFYMDVFLRIGVMFLFCVPFDIRPIKVLSNSVDMAHAIQSSKLVSRLYLCANNKRIFR